jgi:aldehyde dehydrogenase
MNYSEIVHDIVAQVLEQIDTQANLPGVAGQENTYGLFKCVNDAVKAAESAQKQLAKAGIEAREKIVNLLKVIPLERAEEWAKIELDETGVGRLDHKIAKLQILESVPGVEALK